jgi:arylsulfatase A-like enzyme
MPEHCRSTPRDARAITRREFVKAGALGLGAMAAGPGAPAVHAQRPPNLLLILCDQMNLDAMSALGQACVATPNLDRLAARGVTFIQSHSTNPVCSPARSSVLTGRMPVETGVIHNDLPIRPDLPNLGQWLGDRGGYETVYCGKWHLPQGYAPPGLAGFRVLPTGGGQGAGDDGFVSRSCEAYLRNRSMNSGPFLMVASFMQPHDICYWMIHPETLVPERLPLRHIADRLPELPPNHASRPPGPQRIGNGYAGFKMALQWRYYLYCYYRMVEMLDADVGRVLDALQETGQAENTVVVFTSDHGEGAGRHGNVQKWHPYDESMKVPMLWSCPGQVAEGLRDGTHLVSGLDVMSTFCDYASIGAPDGVKGRSLRPLLEGRQVTWRDHLVCEWKEQGRIVRTERYKYVMVEDDPAEQLFDMQADPWEMNNRVAEPALAGTVAEHRRLLAEWNSRMDPALAAG